jgi:hypothetical protein
MKKTVILTAFLILYAAGASANEIGLSVHRQGLQLTVDVMLNNQDTISGLQIPLDLHYRQLGLRLDSVSFIGTRCDGFFELSTQIFQEQEKIFLFLVESADPTLDSHPISPGAGKIATIYLTRESPPQITSWRVTNERILSDIRDLRFLAWTNQAVEVNCTFSGVTINAGN